ncbi:hypothetical protein QAD02_018167 [Eretmocerus hayati]|uniref:Uncharacterized protein n=1 Tax=Eretmocerus hayati TaxID=131215 RepID=A0ACC2PFL5_9HYME|nr:hypothetical protein QAD02_018167 [Eretmocerus hayati]
MIVFFWNSAARPKNLYSGQVDTRSIMNRQENQFVDRLNELRRGRVQGSYSGQAVLARMYSNNPCQRPLIRCHQVILEQGQIADLKLVVRLQPLGSFLQLREVLAPPPLPEVIPH